MKKRCRNQEKKNVFIHMSCLVILLTNLEIIKIDAVNGFHSSQYYQPLVVHGTKPKSKQEVMYKKDFKRRIKSQNKFDNASFVRMSSLPSNTIISEPEFESEANDKKKNVAESVKIPPNFRQISKIEKFARLPVWPAWNGVFLFLLSKVIGNELTSQLEDRIGGRVCPNFFTPAETTSPFIMLVHHCHTFAPWDPLRYIQKSFFPEGFPSHPHRGFITMTYCLKGGMIHRDSAGMKQVYGAESRHNGKHTQWLTTGAGLLHEEMWDIKPRDQNSTILDAILRFSQPSSQELYQLWLNLPSDQKMVPPSVELLGGDDSTPLVIDTDKDDAMKKTKTLILCGEYADKKASVQTASDVTILHVQMDPGSTWSHIISASHETAIIYMRQGAVTVGESLENQNDGISLNRIDPHYTAYLDKYGEHLSISCSSPSIGADFLLLTGAPLNEPIQAQGSMVMNYPDEINKAYEDYQRGYMGLPWDHRINDDEWKTHNSKYPSQYSLEEKK